LNPPLKIAFIASECTPYAKTGGLADVVGALPKALRSLGHEPIVILPKYAFIDRARHQKWYTNAIAIGMPIGQTLHLVAIA